MVAAAVREDIHSLLLRRMRVISADRDPKDTSPTLDALFTFKEAMSYLRVSRSTLYRLMWSRQLTGHKIGSTWRFYLTDLQASVQVAFTPSAVQENNTSHIDNLMKFASSIWAMSYLTPYYQLLARQE